MKKALKTILVILVITIIAWFMYTYLARPTVDTRSAFTTKRTSELMCITDADGVNRNIYTPYFGFRDNMLIEDVEGHSLVFMLKDGNRPTFIHITPCHKCAELEFLKTHPEMQELYDAFHAKMKNS